MAKTLFIENKCAAGDVTVLSAIFRDIHLTYPGEFELHYVGHCRSLFEHNPYVAQIHDYVPKGQRTLNLLYGSYVNQGQTVARHFTTVFPEEFTKRTHIPLELLLPKGDIHLSEEEQARRPCAEPYWVIFPGRKYDFTTKLWLVPRWQQLVDAMQARGLRCVQTGGSGHQFWNPELCGVINEIGTDLRHLCSTIYNAEGVICPITSGMHIAAVFDKPCVVIAGGREHWWWEAYVNSGLPTFGQYASGKVRTEHRYLHTIDMLPCCMGKGCWKNKVSRAEPDKNKSYCEQPVDIGLGQLIPECLRMIEVSHVLEAVMSYYDEQGKLKPIGPAPAIEVPDLKQIPAGPTSRITIHTVEPSIPVSAKTTIVRTLPTPPPKTIAPEIRPASADPFDDPLIGGAYTIFILMYGQEHNYHRNCLGSILGSLPPQRRRIRIGCNAVCEETQLYLSKLLDEGQLEKVYWHQTNDKKYPVMRQMFHDPQLPIDTKYLVWFDDDTTVVDPLWGSKLAHTIISEEGTPCRLFGPGLRWKYHRSQITWIRSRPWFKRRELRLASGQPAPNGNFSHFASGWFWALEVKAMREAGIPDEQIGHNGGDYILAEQLWQAGYTMRSWNNQKQFISTPKNGRRGLVETHTGMPTWIPGGTV